jgi:hypothetical protein
MDAKKRALPKTIPLSSITWFGHGSKCKLEQLRHVSRSWTVIAIDSWSTYITIHVDTQTPVHKTREITYFANLFSRLFRNFSKVTCLGNLPRLVNRLMVLKSIGQALILPLGAKFDPRGEVGPQGWRPSLLINSRECSLLGVNKGFL